MKLLDLQSSLFQAGQWRWPAWWRALEPPLDAAAQPIYCEMTTRLQRDLLLLLMAITIPLGVLNNVQLAYAAFIARSGLTSSFIVHTLSVTLTVLCAVLLLRQGRTVAAWCSVVAITAVAVLLQTGILHEPGLILFAVLGLAGPAIFAPLRITAALVAGLMCAMWLLMRALGIDGGQDWLNVAALFTAIMVGLGCVGIVVRRVARQSAQTTVQAQAEAVQRAQLQQRMDDLRRRTQLLASLEHDLRQPLRTAEGYLGALLAERTDTTDLALPALAAAQHTDRLLSNLLDQARADAQQKPHTRQPTDMAQLWNRVEQHARGLARYRTDPPIPIRFIIEGALPTMRLDAEHVERAILNVLDNALAVSPPDGTITVRARVLRDAVQIDVHDQGPGLPEDVRYALLFDTPSPSFGLGLQQIQRTVNAHGGQIEVDTSAGGTTICLIFPRNQ